MLVINKCVSSPASYPDVSLSMKMCAQRKAGRRQPSVPFPWSLAFRACLYDVNNSVAIRPSDLGGGGTATATGPFSSLRPSSAVWKESKWGEIGKISPSGEEADFFFLLPPMPSLVPG